MLSPYDLLFADQDLDELLTELELAPGSALDAARARLWEGRPIETEDAAKKGARPWSTFIEALSHKHAGQPAKAELLSIARDEEAESRARLWAWKALREEHALPEPGEATRVLGVIAEVPVDGGLDVLAAYTDGSVRFLGHADQLIAIEGDGAPGKRAASVLREASVLLAAPPTQRNPKAPRPPANKVRLTALAPTGSHQVEVPWAEVEAGGKYAKLFHAIVGLLEEVTEH